MTASYCNRLPEVSSELYRRFDFTRLDDCLEAIRGQRYVFICATQRLGSKMMGEHPAAAVLPNLQIGANLLEACSRERVEQVALVGTATVYQPADRDMAEDDLDLNLPCFPLYEGVGGVYRYLEQLAGFYARKAGLGVTLVRATNIYGPRDNFDPDRSNVLPGLMRRAVDKEDPFVVWGDGQAVRDFIFVEDFVTDLLALFARESRPVPYNIGQGRPATIDEAVAAVLEVCGHHPRIEHDLSRATAAPVRTVSIARLEGLLGPRPRTSLVDGLRQMHDWYLRSTAPRP